MEKKKRKTHYRQVQSVSLDGIPNATDLVEAYEYLGYHTKVKGATLLLFWGTKPKKTDKEKVVDENKKERRSKTERRLGRKFSRPE